MNPLLEPIYNREHGPMRPLGRIVTSEPEPRDPLPPFWLWFISQMLAFLAGYLIHGWSR